MEHREDVMDAIKEIKVKQIEFEEQCALFTYADYMSNSVSEWGLLFAIPVGGLRNRATGAKLKRSGTKAGVPDMFLPVARGSYHGLFIELKSPKGTLQPNQAQWLTSLSDQGYKTTVCRSYENARDTIENYLKS
ncbi:MAG: VRR-NUC domain-containing protein [Candidatus Peribacteraceae bacterium]|nr:VRR-NUC domain-containing protein [Candidatus Peribacteraceae bacterium]